MTDDDIRAAITAALSGATARPLTVEVLFNEIGDVFARVDMCDADQHFSQNINDDFLVEYHPREMVERDLGRYCETLARSFRSAL